MALMNKRHRARARQRSRSLSQTQGEEEEEYRYTMRSASSSPWLCKYSVASFLFLMTLMWFPQPGRAQRPHRMQLQQQRQLEQQRQQEQDLEQQQELEQQKQLDQQQELEQQQHLERQQEIDQQQQQQQHLEQPRNPEKQEDIQPSTCIETGIELLNALRDYYGRGASNEYNSSAARTYGWPIDGWCVSSDVATKIESDSKSPLKEQLLVAVENIADGYDDDIFTYLDPHEMIFNWSNSADLTSCLDVCSTANGVASFAAPTSSYPANEENVANYKTEGGDDQEDQAPLGDSASDSDIDTTNITNNEESDSSGSKSSGSRNNTTTGMLIRLIPVKLLALLSFMCLALGVRQMFLSAERDNAYCCCCKLGSSLFDFRTGGYASYEGIDPSDVTDHQKGVEFELLQLAASGDMDGEIDVVIS